MRGQEIEPLAFRVKPLPEECFESWLRRLAERHDTTSKALFHHLGIDAALAGRDLASLTAGVPEQRQVMVERLAWATMVPEEAVVGTFVGCGKADLLPRALRSIGCAQCWHEWLVAGEPWRIERSWILRVATCCQTHMLLLTDLRGIMALGRVNVARRLLEERVERTRADMARFTFVKTRLTWSWTLSREHVRGLRPRTEIVSPRYRATLVGNHFHYAPARHLLLAAVHSTEGLEAGQLEQIFRFATRPARVASPVRVRRGVKPKLSDLMTTIARIGLRQLERKRRMLDAVGQQLERAKRNYVFVYSRNMALKSRVALAREVRLRRAAASAGAETLTQTCLRGFQEALSYLKESGMADDAVLVGHCGGDPWAGCHGDVDLLRARLKERFADPLFRIPLDLAGYHPGNRWE
ncbi:TniQ family protein [Sphingobium sp. TKS]|uniref:TniQ family protein n=1 Tax=Sphingobium sp. TKS TaxID=1315974 RepID=UPI000830199F|nr:TniQ family protein [Sphingobium sp. TKS]